MHLSRAGVYMSSDNQRKYKLMAFKGHRHKTLASLAGIAVVIALFSLFIRACTETDSNDYCVVGPTGETGACGPSAYEVWLALGNEGTEDDFIASLTGPKGAAGTSAYETWLLLGNSGSEAVFIESLRGPTGSVGADGVDELSAYELWLSLGNTGTEEDFIESLRGPTGGAGVDGSDGVDGVDGSDGLSAYEVWLVAGNTGTIGDFLLSLVGPSGVTGAAGLSAYQIWLDLGNEGTPIDFIESLRGPSGSDGQNGINGLSAYEVWQSLGNTGTMQDFINSLIGPQGIQGEPGPQGPAGTSGLGASASFWDTTQQGDDGPGGYLANVAYPMLFNSADSANNVGITMTSGSRITFTLPGVYNIAFSAQISRSQGGSVNEISIWLRKNGVDVPETATDVSLFSNGSRLVAAWNFFAPVTCNGTCDYYQLVWSSDSDHTALLYDPPRNTPLRPAVPSVILTVNQVR